MKPALLTTFAAAALLLALAASPATAAGPPPTPAAQPEGSNLTRSGQAATSSCAWRWKRKRMVRWVRRKHPAKGKRGRKARFRKVVRHRRVRVCVPVPPPPAPARLGVKAHEWGFTLSATSLPPGDTIVELVNRGEDTHNLHLKPLADGNELFTPDLKPAETARLRLTSEPGEYRLWCSLPTHAERGMDTTIAVGTGP